MGGDLHIMKLNPVEPVSRITHHKNLYIMAQELSLDNYFGLIGLFEPNDSNFKYQLLAVCSKAWL